MKPPNTDKHYPTLLNFIRDITQSYPQLISEINRLKHELNELSTHDLRNDSAQVSAALHPNGGTPRSSRLNDPVYHAYISNERYEKEVIQPVKNRISRLESKIHFVNGLVNKLPPKEKKAITLKWLDGLSWEETAFAMQIGIRHAMRINALAFHQMTLSASGQGFDPLKGQPPPS